MEQMLPRMPGMHAAAGTAQLGYRPRQHCCKTMPPRQQKLTSTKAPTIAVTRLHRIRKQHPAQLRAAATKTPCAGTPQAGAVVLWRWLLLLLLLVLLRRRLLVPCSARE